MTSNVYVLADPGNSFTTAIPGSTGSGTGAIQIPVTGVTSLRINGGDGDDTLIIDGSGGDPLFTRDVIFDGGNGIDGITVNNFPGSFVSGVNINGGGKITVNGTRELRFKNLEPIDLSGSVVTTLEVQIDPASTVTGPVTATLSNHANAGITRIDFDNGLESLFFPTPTVSLTITGDLTDGDIINIEGVDASWNVPIIINGGGGADVVTFQTNPTVTGGGDLTVTAETVNILTVVVTDILTVNGGYNLAAGSTLNVELNGTTPVTGHDQVDVTGTVTINDATLTGSLGFTPAVGDAFVIINNDGTDTVTGTFNGLAEGSTLNLGGQDFSITYAGGTGNDVVLTAVFLDFGDAPDTGAGTGTANYQTTDADGSPSHTIVTGLLLGSNIDGDDGTLQNSTANADDVDGALPDDEDGVVDPLDLQGTIGTAPTVTLLATNTSGVAATLNGWIDYNQDGVFDNATERAQATVNSGATNGQITLTFPAIPNGSIGSTYARFRLSTDPAADAPTGFAADGEVEDYAFNMTALTDASFTQSSTKIAHELNGGPTLADADLFGSGVTSVGDLNGDGVIDLAVGAFVDDTGWWGGGNRGAVYILMMNADGTVDSRVKIASGVNGGPPLGNGSGFGNEVASLGDIDGDGVGDLAVGAFRDNTGGGSRGAVYVLHMNSDGSVNSSTKIASGLNGSPALGNYGYFGVGVASLGDVDGDGITDLAVGHYKDGTGGTRRGAVHVLLLNSDGTVKSSSKIASGTPGAPALANDDLFGASVTSMGDLDGDGVTDIAVGARKDKTGGTNRGAVHVLLLNPDGSVKEATKFASGINGTPALANGNAFGASVLSIGDLNGDGTTDLIVGANGDGTGGAARGAIYLLNLPAADVTAPETTSFTRQTPATTPAIADTLVFRATFSEAVTAVDTGDFTVNGTTTASVTNVVTSDAGAGLLWDVTVAGGNLAMFDGTVGLDLSGAQDIPDLAGNALPNTEPATDETYQVVNVVSDITFEGGALTFRERRSASNLYSIRLDATVTPNEFVFSDPGNPIVIDVAGSSGSGTDEVRVPVTSINSLVVNSGDGDDTLTLDGSGDAPFPIGGVIYDGGNGTDGIEIANLAGAYIIPLNAAGAGSVEVGQSTVVSFSNLEPIDLSASTVTTLEIRIDDSKTVDGPVTATLSNHADAGLTRIDFDNGLESVFFPTPSVSLTISGDAVRTDVINVEGVDASRNVPIIINGNGGADIVRLQSNSLVTNGGDVTIAADTVSVDTAVLTDGGDVSITGIRLIINDDISTGSGDVSVTAGRNILLEVGSSITTVSGDVALSSDVIVLNLNSEVSDAGNLTIKPKTASTNIDVGEGFINSATSGNLTLSPDTLSALAAGFNSITIGDVDNGTGAVDIRNAGFSDPLTIAGSPISVTGSVDLGGATLNIDDTGFTANGGESLILIDNDGSDAVTGIFDGLPEGALVTVGGLPLVVTYVGGDGNDVQLVGNTVSVSGPAEEVREGEDAVFTVSLLQPAAAPITVALSLNDGTATLGSGDFAGLSASGTLSTVSFATDEQTKTVNVSTLFDGINEPDETFELSLEGVFGTAALSTTENSASATIDGEELKLVDIPDQTIAADTGPVTIEIAATSTDGQPATLTADNLPAYATFTDSGNGTATITFDPSNSDIGSGTVNFTATDSNSSRSNSFNVEVVAAESVQKNESIIRINAAGGAVGSFGGDQFANTGNRFSTRASIDLSDESIPEGTPEAIFQTTRWDARGGAELSYNIPVAAGDYQVRLYFAEIYGATSRVGARVFNVDIEGQRVLTDFDVFSEAGAANKGIVRTFDVTSDGTVNIEFGHVVENPDVMAIEIIDRNTIINTAPVVSPVAAQSVTPGESLTIPVTAADPDEADVITLAVQGLPDFATFTDNGDGTGDGTGEININPAANDEGTFPLTLQATSGDQSLTDTTGFELALNEIFDLG